VELASRQPDEEFAPMAKSGAPCLDHPPVKLYETLGQGKADAQPALGAILAGLDLREHRKDARQRRRRHSDASIRD
jgi:hypothetical protein